MPYSFENITFASASTTLTLSAPPSPETWDDWLRIAVGSSGARTSKSTPRRLPRPTMDRHRCPACAAMDNPYTAMASSTGRRPSSSSASPSISVSSSEELTPPRVRWLARRLLQRQGRLGAGRLPRRVGAERLRTDKVATSIATKVEGGAGSVYWGNSVALLNGISTQEAMDYIVYTMGPQNTN